MTITSLSLEDVDKEGVFEQKIQQLRNILDIKSGALRGYSCKPFYFEDALKEIIHAKLTKDQEKVIYEIFEQRDFLNDKSVIESGRGFRKIDQNEVENHIPAIISELQKSKIWEGISPKLPEIFPSHHEKIVKAFNEELMVFTFEDMKSAKNEDKEEIFQRKLVQLERIGKSSREIDEKILNVIIEAELTRNQEERIYNLIPSGMLRVSRLILQYNREPLGANLAIIINKIQSYNGLWDRIQPKLITLSPNRHQQITDAYLEKIKTLSTRFQEILEGLKKEWNTVGALAKLEKFKSDYGVDNDYGYVEWEAFYQLIKEKSCLMTREQFKQFMGFYLYGIGRNKNPSKVETLRVNLLRFDNKVTPLFTMITAKQDYDNKDILELLADLELNPSNEKVAIPSFFSGELKELYYLERFKNYCRNIKEEKYNEYWNLESLKTYFGAICEKLYGNEILQTTFRDIVECAFLGLTSKQRDEIKTTSEYYKTGSHYLCCLIMAQAKELKRLETENNDSAELFKSIEENLKALVQKHVTFFMLGGREVTYGQILSVFSYIQFLKLPEALNKPILEIFRSCKAVTYNDYYDKDSYYGVETSNSSSTWEGELYNTFFNTMQAWFNVNKTRLLETSKEDKRSPDLLRHVEKLFKLIQATKLPEKASISEQNKNLQEFSMAFIAALREALANTKFHSSYKRLLTLGEEEAGTSTVILKEVCHLIFTRMNPLPHIMKTMKESFALSLEELAKKNRQIWYLAERELSKPIELQNEVIEGLPEASKSPFLNLLNNSTFKFLTLKYDAKGKENSVDLFRMPSCGITPEFRVFLRSMHRSLLISMDDQIQLEPTDNIFVASFKVSEVPASPDFRAFKKWLVDQLLENKGLPEELKDDEIFKNALETLVDDVKNIFYYNSTSLDADQKRNFIEFYRLRLAFYLISYTNATNFAFFSKGQEFYNSLTVQLLATLFNKNEFDEMGAALVCGAKMEKRELSEAFADPGVQERLRKNGFGIKGISSPNFDL